MLEEAGMSFPGQAELQRYHNMFLKSANYSSLGVQLYLSLLIKSIISNAKKLTLFMNCTVRRSCGGLGPVVPVKQGWGTLVSCRF